MLNTAQLRGFKGKEGDGNYLSISLLKQWWFSSSSGFWLKLLRGSSSDVNEKFDFKCYCCKKSGVSCCESKGTDWDFRESKIMTGDSADMDLLMEGKLPHFRRSPRLIELTRQRDVPLQVHEFWLNKNRIYEVVKTRISEREKTTTLNFVYDFATTRTDVGKLDRSGKGSSNSQGNAESSGNTIFIHGSPKIVEQLVDADRERGEKCCHE
ncbi:hypothetical protein C5167_000708 [Papaver somniferum]|uniref:Uncharacterized protein n=1 Tax=Papaver somniferum TaxID=3469 RepID=A0A4Y7KW48_PAPSO|nr:hypothetical protein C5167_000708 [Papaver somniferum]